MRFRRLLGCVAIVVVTAACSSQPALPSRADRLSFLRNLGLAVDDAKVIERGNGLEFPQGECGAKLLYFDGKPRLEIYKDEGYSLETLYGDDIRNAGKTAATRVCDLDKKLTPPSEASGTKADAVESR